MNLIPKKLKSYNLQAGFSLVEVLLAVSVFSLIVTALTGGLIYGQQSTALAGMRSRAAVLADEGLEVARNIRDENFPNLADGTHGLAISGNQWGFSGTSDATDIFTRQIVISTVDAKRKSVTANVTWQQNAQRTGLVSAVTYLTNWKITVGQADGLAVNTSGANLGGGDKELRGITIENTGSDSIIIDKITVIWNNSELIEDIKIDNTRIWFKNGPGAPSGNQPSGTELDIQDFTLAQGSGVIDIDKFRFNGKMTGATFSITFTMSDGSTKTVSEISPL